MIEERQNDRVSTRLFPLKIEFRASAGVEYILKIKDLNAWGRDYGQINERDYLYILTDIGFNTMQIRQIYFDNNSELNYVFKQESSGYISLYFSGIPRLKESTNKKFWMNLSLDNIRIGRLPPLD